MPQRRLAATPANATPFCLIGYDKNISASAAAAELFLGAEPKTLLFSEASPGRNPKIGVASHSDCATTLLAPELNTSQQPAGAGYQRGRQLRCEMGTPLLKMGSSPRCGTRPHFGQTPVGNAPEGDPSALALGSWGSRT